MTILANERQEMRQMFERETALLHAEDKRQQKELKEQNEKLQLQDQKVKEQNEKLKLQDQKLKEQNDKLKLKVDIWYKIIRISMGLSFLLGRYASQRSVFNVLYACLRMNELSEWLNEWMKEWMNEEMSESINQSMIELLIF